MNYDFLDNNKLIPVVVLGDIDETLPKLGALKEGGINVAEITFRTACAEECIRLACERLPDMLIGAGTVVNAEQCRRAIAAGAKFVVSPGLSEDVYNVCSDSGVPYLAGAVTPTEIIAAKALGLNVLKFFPAEAFGGAKTLKALSAAFRDISFVPTGGIGEDNFIDYLSLPCVKAVGGSWMMKGDIAAKSACAVKKLSEIG